MSTHTKPLANMLCDWLVFVFWDFFIYLYVDATSEAADELQKWCECTCGIWRSPEIVSTYTKPS